MNLEEINNYEVSIMNGSYEIGKIIIEDNMGN